MALKSVSRVVVSCCVALLMSGSAFAQLVTSVTPSQFPVGSNATALFAVTNGGQQAVTIPMGVTFEFAGPPSLVQPTGAGVVAIVSTTGLVPTQFGAYVTLNPPDGSLNPTVVLGCALPYPQDCQPLTLAPGDSLAAQFTVSAGAQAGATIVRPTIFTFSPPFYVLAPPIPIAVTDLGGVQGFTPPGALIMLPAGVQPPLGYTFVGSFQQSLRPNPAGSSAGGAEVKVQINVYKKN